MSTDHQHHIAEEIDTEIDDCIKGRIGGQDVDIHIVEDIETVIVEETQDAHGAGDHDHDHDHPKPEKTYVIQVNTQNVTMQQPKATGAEIKAAAIAQGVAIEPEFVLSVKHGDRYDIVGDDDEVTLHKGLDFIATAADDNS